MGTCSTKQISKNLPTLYEQLIADRGVLTFIVSQKQMNPEKIKGIRFILAKTNQIFQIKLNHVHPGRKIVLNLWALAQKNEVSLPINQKIEYCFCFVYSQAYSQPTSVKQFIFSPLNDLELKFRMNLESTTKQKSKIIEELVEFNNGKISYYQNHQTFLNILLLGSRCVGKSSFLLSLSKILEMSNCSPQIGNEDSYEISTTKEDQKYQFFNKKKIKINLIDTPGLTSNFDNKKIQQLIIADKSQKVTHAAIIFVNPHNSQSLQVSKQISKLLTQLSLEYLMVFVRWQQSGQAYEDYYINRVNDKLQTIYRNNNQSLPTQKRIYPLSNKQCDANNVFAQIAHLECYKHSLQLGAAYYTFHQPIHILLEDKVVAIRHRISAKTLLSQFIINQNIQKIIQEESLKNFTQVLVERLAGGKGQKGISLIEKELKDKRSLEDYIQIAAQRYKVIKFYLKAPYFSYKLY